MAEIIDIASQAFQYPKQVHRRRHGPRGYANYQSFKPWLRDEFGFRCVYCLWRERWHAIGEDAFSVDHLRSRAKAPDLICEYDNLVYACCRCNSVKSDADSVLDPGRQAYGDHLQVVADGTIRPLTADGQVLIQVCHLARPKITDARRRLLDLFRTLQASNTPRAGALLKHYLGYCDNPPILAHARPPAGNSRPEGIVHSFYELQMRNELPTVY